MTLSTYAWILAGMQAVLSGQQGYDVWSTIRDIQLGGSEGNGIMADLQAELGRWWWVTKLIFVLIFGFQWWALYHFANGYLVVGMTYFLILVYLVWSTINNTKVTNELENGQ